MILKGNPSDELLRYSKEPGTDILVIGSIGRTAISKFLLGSVAEKVVRHSEVPVMIVPFNSVCLPRIFLNSLIRPDLF